MTASIILSTATWVIGHASTKPPPAELAHKGAHLRILRRLCLHTHHFALGRLLDE